MGERIPMHTPMPVPTLPPPNSFDGGCAFADGAYVALADAKISLFDWGFTRSDATYDVASCWKGAFFRLDTHMDRFFASLDKMRLATPYSRAELRQILHGCVRAAGLKEAYVAMVCTRLDGVPLPRFPGPVSKRLQEAYWALHDEPAYRDPVEYGAA